jgi:hypothetical protein
MNGYRFHLTCKHSVMRILINVLLSFFTVVFSFAQAPGWSRGQQLLSISNDVCVSRASQVLQLEGYRIDYAAGNFAVGIKDVHTAVVMCNSLEHDKTYVNIVVASNGEGGGLQRQRLQAQMENPGSLSGAGSSPCGLGMIWDETEEGWTAVWTRRGSSNIFDVKSTKGGAVLTAVHLININQNLVTVTRTNTSDGNDCEMQGTIGSDGTSVTGTYRCKSGGPYNWSAKIRCTVNVNCGLGVRWEEQEEGWTAVWTRRGNSNVFDVSSSKSGMTLTAVQTININGNQVAINRTFSSDGNTCEMQGTIGVDGVTVTGTYHCKNGGPFSWKAIIICQ